jgi:hypothetical protein
MATTLAKDLEWPCFDMPLWEAMGQRLWRNYQWVFGIQFGSWLFVLMSHPAPTNSLLDLVFRASILKSVYKWRGSISNKIPSDICHTLSERSAMLRSWLTIMTQ